MNINDLPAQCPYCEIMLFADDVKAYKRIRSPSNRTVLQVSLNNLCRWARDCELGISTDKCYYLQLSYQNLTLIYKLNADIIAPCTSVVDLGINVHSNLKYGPHCAIIASKANARVKLILKFFLSRNQITMTRAFIIYVRPLLEYCSPVWSPHFKQDIDLIENVQRSFTRKLFYCCNLVSKSYDDRLTYLGLQRLELRRIYADLIYMYKLIHDNISSSLIKVFKFNNQVHCRETRGHRYKLFFNRSNKLVFSNFFYKSYSPNLESSS